MSRQSVFNHRVDESIKNAAEQLQKKRYASVSLDVEQQVIINGLFEISTAFHQSPISKKKLLSVDRTLNNRGYVSSSKAQYGDTLPDGEVVRGYSSLDIGACEAIADVEEISNVLSGPNELPVWIEGFGTSLQQGLGLFADLSRSLFPCLCDLLEVPKEELSFSPETTCSQLRLLHYSPKTADVLGIKAHTDYEFFTFVCSTAPGLQVLLDNNRWVTVDDEPNKMFVLAGDCLETWSNGKIRAISHRVNLSAAERYSIAYFASTSWQRVLRCIGTDYYFDPTLHQAKFAIRNNRHLREAHKMGIIKLATEIEDKNSFGDH